MQFKLIVVAVRTDLSDRIVDAAKKAGATGATIIPARGTGLHEARTFFGLTLEIQRDVLLLLLAEHLVDPVLKAIREEGSFHEPGTGISFVLDVEKVAGLDLQTRFLEQKQKSG